MCCVIMIYTKSEICLLCFQVEHLEVSSSQDKIFVFLHRGAMVGGKEVNLCMCSSGSDL